MVGERHPADWCVPSLPALLRDGVETSVGEVARYPAFAQPSAEESRSSPVNADELLGWHRRTRRAHRVTGGSPAGSAGCARGRPMCEASPVQPAHPVLATAQQKSAPRVSLAMVHGLTADKLIFSLLLSKNNTELAARGLRDVLGPVWRLRRQLPGLQG